MKEERGYLWDMLRAARAIIEFTSLKSLVEYRSHHLLRSAVERQFIGEALRLAASSNPDLRSRIDKSRQIIAFRNQLVHGYDVISDDVVWDIVEHDIPALVRQLEALLEKTPRE